ncbi:hypothetical protein D3C85_1762680 [compost metagenome]
MSAAVLDIIGGTGYQIPGMPSLELFIRQLVYHREGVKLEISCHQRKRIFSEEIAHKGKNYRKQEADGKRNQIEG